MLHCSLLESSLPLCILECHVKSRTFLSGLTVFAYPSEFIPRETQVNKSIILYQVLESVTAPKDFNSTMIPLFQANSAIEIPQKKPKMLYCSSKLLNISPKCLHFLLVLTSIDGYEGRTHFLPVRHPHCDTLFLW